jgi:hypothetical protein
MGATGVEEKEDKEQVKHVKYTQRMVKIMM